MNSVVKPFKFICLLCMGALLSSCSLFNTINDFESPKFTYKKHYLHDIDNKKVVVMVEMEADNPNPVSIHGLVVNYTMNVKGKRFASGADTLIESLPNQITFLKVPVTIQYKDLERTLGNVLKHILLDRREVNAEILLEVTEDGQIETESGWTMSIPTSYSKRIDQTIPLPKRSDVKKAMDKEVKKLKNRLKKLF